MWQIISSYSPLIIALLFCGIIFAIFYYFQHRFCKDEKRIVNDYISKSLGVFSASDRTNFYDQYESIRERLLESQEFQNIWSEFEETLIIDSDEKTITTTKRPHDYFNESSIISPYIDLRTLNAVPNYLVGLGLVFTFGGLVFAIYLASKGLGSPDEGQEALKNLLQTAGVKFLTSITGLLCSMVFSYRHKKWLNSLNKKIHDICCRIEKLTYSVTTEQLLNKSLKEQKAQSNALEHLADEIARQIENALADKLPASVGNAMHPLVAELKALAQKLSSTNHEGLEQMLQSFTNKLEHAANGEIRDLVDGLKNIQVSLQGLLEHIQNTGEAFGSKIVGAADDLNETLNRTLNNFTEKLESAAQSEIQDLVGGLKVMQDSLQGLSSHIQTTGESFGEKISGAANGIGSTLMPISKNLLAFNENIEMINGKLTTQLDRFDANVSSLNVTLENIKETASHMYQAGQPVSNAADSIKTAARSLDATQKQIEDAYSSSQEATDAMKHVSQEIVNVWSSYSARFKEVDQDMGKAFVSIQDGLHDFRNNINTFVSQFEGAFSGAIKSLSSAIRELADERAESHQMQNLTKPKIEAVN